MFPLGVIHYGSEVNARYRALKIRLLMQARGLGFWGLQDQKENAVGTSEHHKAVTV